MGNLSKKAAGLASAGCLAALTMSVFLASWNRGPASAVTRFNQAICSGNDGILRGVTSGSMESPSLQILVRSIRALKDNGGKFQIDRVIVNSNDALILAHYQFKPNGLQSLVFSAHKFNGTWLVSPEETLIRTRSQLTGS